MVLSTFMTSITRCCVTATTLTRYAELYREWKHNQKLITLLPLIMVHQIIIEISTHCAVEGKCIFSLSGLPP
nr:MAG TPA: hypothetical protein [Caudoviricetes sp.]